MQRDDGIERVSECSVFFDPGSYVSKEYYLAHTNACVLSLATRPSEVRSPRAENMKRLLAVVLSFVVPTAVFAGDNAYKVEEFRAS